MMKNFSRFSDEEILPLDSLSNTTSEQKFLSNEQRNSLSSTYLTPPTYKKQNISQKFTENFSLSSTMPEETMQRSIFSFQDPPNSSPPTAQHHYSTSLSRTLTPYHLDPVLEDDGFNENQESHNSNQSIHDQKESDDQYLGPQFLRSPQKQDVQNLSKSESSTPNNFKHTSEDQKEGFHFPRFDAKSEKSDHYSPPRIFAHDKKSKSSIEGESVSPQHPVSTKSYVHKLDNETASKHTQSLQEEDFLSRSLTLNRNSPLRDSPSQSTHIRLSRYLNDDEKKSYSNFQSNREVPNEMSTRFSDHPNSTRPNRQVPTSFSDRSTSKQSNRQELTPFFRSFNFISIKSTKFSSTF